MLSQFFSKLAWGHRAFIEFNPRVAFALGVAFDGHEYLGPNSLWAGITTPNPATKYGDKKQAKCTDNQKPRQ